MVPGTKLWLFWATKRNMRTAVHMILAQTIGKLINQDRTMDHFSSQTVSYLTKLNQTFLICRTLMAQILEMP